MPYYFAIFKIFFNECIWLSPCCFGRQPECLHVWFCKSWKIFFQGKILEINFPAYDVYKNCLHPYFWCLNLSLASLMSHDALKGTGYSRVFSRGNMQGRGQISLPPLPTPQHNVGTSQRCPCKWWPETFLCHPPNPAPCVGNAPWPDTVAASQEWERAKE